MKSLKTKLIVTLIGSNILVITLFALITPWMVQQRFLEQAKHIHYQNFTRMIEQYINHAHSWNTDEDARRIAAIAAQIDQTRPGPDTEFIGPESANRIPLQKQDMTFMFAVFDADGRTIIGGKDNYAPGYQINREKLAKADPLRINDEIVAYVLPSGQIPLTPADLSYLEVLRESLLYATALSLLILIPFGFWEGSKLVRSLKQLTDAVEHMAQGKLQQQVEIPAKDEIGRLGQAFNTMNTELVQAYHKLEESHATIVKQAEELKELSIRDALTGLYNRRFFNEEVGRLHDEARRCRYPFCLVLGDVDHFKKINDHFSHTVGDQVLKQVAQILRCSLRESDIVARYGGEEFVIALSNTKPQEAMELIERIRAGIENYPWHEIAEDLSVTMSFGISDQLNTRHFEHMLVLADEQLYLAKNQGRNQVRCLNRPTH